MRLDALVINLNRFGDLLLSQPLLHDLHKAGRSTTLLCLEKYADTEGLLQFASPLLTVPDHLVSPEQADATRHELQAWAENLRASVQADHIINLTPSMPARLLATALAPRPRPCWASDWITRAARAWTVSGPLSSMPPNCARATHPSTWPTCSA